MSARLTNYLVAARHPWACVLFVVPVLLLYEAGLRMLGPTPDEVRTGADVWARMAATELGLSAWAAPMLLVGGLLVWGLTRPRESLLDPLGTWIGMAAESVAFACLLFLVVQLAYPLLAILGGTIQNVFLMTSAGRSPEQTWESIVRYMGAGIYEEAIFRLVLFSGIRLLFVLGDFPERWANVLAGIGSALIFASAHQAGAEHVNATIFLYRASAGLYFAWLFQIRGFGIAVGAHAGFDVLVGLVMR